MLQQRKSVVSKREKKWEFMDSAKEGGNTLI